MPPPTENARIGLVVILIIWLMITPDNNNTGYILGPHAQKERLARQRRAHGVLNSTQWGDFSPPLAGDPNDTVHSYLNITGFREQDGFAWDDLGRFRERCVEWSHNLNPATEDMETGTGRNRWDMGEAETTWQNATGVVKGDWVRREGSVPRGWSNYNFTEMTPGVSWSNYPGVEWSRNVTAADGSILLRVEDKHRHMEYEEVPDSELISTGGLAREVVASVTLQDAGEGGSGTQFDMRLHGVHWPKQGNLLLTTTSEKFGGIFGLPHLTPDANFFKSSQKLLNETIDAVLRKKEKSVLLDLENPWSSAGVGAEEAWHPSPRCEFIFYLQIHPLDDRKVPRKVMDGYSDQMQSVVQDLEDELRYPTGRPGPHVPELQMSAVVYSPDCAFFLESKGPPHFPRVQGEHLVGFKEDVYLYDIKIWVLFFAAVVFGQVQLLKGQTKESYTPSTMGRISFWTMNIMLLADGLLFAASSILSLNSIVAFLPALILTFALFTSMLIGGAFLAEIYKVQEPEWRIRDREPPSNNTTPRPPSTPASLGDSLPPPVTAGLPRRAPSPPIIIPSDQDVDAEIAANVANGAAAVPTASTTGGGSPQMRTATFSTIIGRLIMSGMFILFLSIASLSWWSSLRSAYVNTLAFVYLSFWIPQIIRNTTRNSRRAFSWHFMIGQSVLRITPIAYFYLCKNNLLFSDTDWMAFTVLAGWLWVQLWILAFQDVLGPRFGMPKGWLPEAWDYHPILREDNLEAGGLPIGLAVSASAPGSPTLERVNSVSSTDGDYPSSKEKSKRTRTRVIDCAICREDLEVSVIKAGEQADPTSGGVAGLLERRKYMVTPCRHIFHAQCLEGWLRFRLQCPICREELPPL